MAITKADLARAVYERHGGITTRQAADLVDAILSILKLRLAEGCRLLLGELGVMETAERRDRRGRRPGAGRRAARRALQYYPSPALSIIDKGAEERPHPALERSRWEALRSG